MIVVVADTTPLRYLVEIGYEYVLPRLFERVWIPGAVAGELQQERTPVTVSRWAAQLPSWVEVRQVIGGPSAHEPAGWIEGSGRRLNSPKP